jgi:hypothetical protein
VLRKHPILRNINLGKGLGFLLRPLTKAIPAVDMGQAVEEEANPVFGWNDH